MTASLRPQPSRAPAAGRTARARARGSTKQVQSSAVQRAARPRPRPLRLDAVAEGGSVQDWLDAGCDGFKGMRTVRPQAWGIQDTVDGLHDAGALGEDGAVQADVPLGAARGDGGRTALAAAFRAAAAQLLAPLAGSGLPAGLLERVRRDAEEVGVAVAEMIPTADKVSLKLELIRENVCLRWHQDNYVARAIVSYNCRGTEYVHDDHVDFWELDNCGNNDCVVRDPAAVCQAGVGDILLMKGKLFPGAVNGLVHRSPGYEYHPSGVVKARLVLKIDVRRAMS
ncbi:unnamed protein product [Prorocentrum cordatum]|uniref:DUF1826 domain-containing protein n=1 Tax=Prorocentrum cordatum TaxID=2364126 RepID=A0ABN9VXX5_9DINO|nr:unnamed protein product [Polarella glacialis]